MSFPFFIEMAWKSAAIAAAALLLAALLRSRSPADRAAVLRLGAGLLLALPLISLLLPALQIEMAAASRELSPVPPALLTAGEMAAPAAAAAVPVETAALAGPVEPSIWDDPGVLIALLYLGGLLMAGLRIGAGLWTLRRWTAAGREVECPEWAAAFERARAAAGCPDLRLLVSAEAPSPLSWGWLRPVILIDSDAEGRPEDAEAILAHEVAHVVRRDWPALMLSRIAAAIFWFNPLVRLLEREFVQQAEEAADSLALRRLEPARYAQTLVSCAELCRGPFVPANSIASKTGLGRRVKAILDGRLLRAKPGSVWSVAAMALAVAFAAPLAALEMVEAQTVEDSADDAPEAPVAAAAPAAVAAPQAADSAIADDPDMEVAMAEEDLDEIGRTVEQSLAAVLPQIPAIVASAMSAVDTAEISRAAVAEAQAQAAAASREAQRAIAEARISTQEALREARRAHVEGARGMEEGAKGMEQGARQMAEEARKLRSSRAYREEQIAKAAARGEHLTHEELLEAAAGLEEGSRGMLEGAREMRQAAADMRRRAD